LELGNWHYPINYLDFKYLASTHICMCIPEGVALCNFTSLPNVWFHLTMTTICIITIYYLILSLYGHILTFTQNLTLGIKNLSLSLVIIILHKC
jgi:hypothetical protein